MASTCLPQQLISMLRYLLIPLLAQAAYVPSGDSSEWTTLTPSTTLSGATTDYTSSFGIAIMPVSAKSATTTSSAGDDITIEGQASITFNRRDYLLTVVQPVSQIGDGQIQGAYTYVTTIKDQTNTAYVTQTLTTTNTETASKTLTASETETQIESTTKQCEECITTNTVFTLTGEPTEEPTTTSCGGFVTFTTKHKGTTYIVQSAFDQCGATTMSESVTDFDSVTTIFSTATEFPTSTDNLTVTTATSTAEPESPDIVSCKVNGTLTMTLEKSILKDSSNRVGSIVANHQFQFDGPTPQAGAIYAAGWGVLDGKLALANSTVFYQCLSGTFYNLYDENIGAQCEAVYLEIVNLVDC